MPERTTLKGNLREALLLIKQDALSRVDYKKRFRLWSYEHLANVYGEVEDWKCEGRIRSAITGSAARRWLQEDYYLWWKADDAEHTGLCFTCDPRTGIEWDRARVAERTFSDGVYLQEASECAVRLQPVWRAHFRKIGKMAKRLKATGTGLKELGDTDLLKLLGVEE